MLLKMAVIRNNLAMFHCICNAKSNKNLHSGLHLSKLGIEKFEVFFRMNEVVQIWDVAGAKVVACFL